MKLRFLLVGIAIGIVSVILLGQVAAQEGGEGGMGMQPPAWTKLTKEHERFNERVGEWDYTMKLWMAPGAPPSEGRGTTSAKLLWNGNYLYEESNGSFDWGGQRVPFEGRLIQGYDTITKEYVSVWMDSFSPIMGISRGTYEDGAVTFHSEEPDHLNPAGAKKKVKVVARHDSKDKHTVTFYDVKPDGDVKTGEIVYTRKKSAE
ncbi:MAG: DUF1579 family protein [Planctomycetota bacterium]